MFSGYDLVFFESRRHQGSPGEVVGSSEQPSRSLLDGQDGFLGEAVFFHSGNLEVVIEISLHFFEG